MEGVLEAGRLMERRGKETPKPDAGLGWTEEERDVERRARLGELALCLPYLRL